MKPDFGRDSGREIECPKSRLRPRRAKSILAETSDDRRPLRRVRFHAGKGGLGFSEAELSNPYLNGAWLTKAPSLAAKMVLVRLADRADDATGIAWPGVASIARDCGMSRRGVQKALRQLQEAKLIEHVEGGRWTRTYRLLILREPGSPPGRTPCASPANDIRLSCEPGSPKPKATQTEPSKEPMVIPGWKVDEDYRKKISKP